MSYRIQFLFLSLLLFLSSCSFWKSKEPSVESANFNIITVPEGAEVYTTTGEKIGETPIALTKEQASKFATGTIISFIVKKFGYIEREVAVPVVGIDEYRLTLTPLDLTHFKQWVLRAYSKPTNEMMRKLLNIQGLLFLRKNDDAKKAIDEFSKEYESIAAAHTMLATLLIAEGKELESKAHLLRALSIDQNDDTAQRLLRRLEGGKQQ